MDKFKVEPYEFKPSTYSRAMTTKDLALLHQRKLREIISNDLGTCIEAACDPNGMIAANESRFKEYIVFDYSTAAEPGKVNATISTSSALIKSNGMHDKITGVHNVASGIIATLTDEVRELFMPYMFDNIKSVKDDKWKNHIKCINGPNGILQVVLNDINIRKMLAGFVFPSELVYDYTVDDDGQVTANAKKVDYNLRFINNKVVNTIYGIAPDEHVYNIEVSAYFKEIVEQEFAEIYPVYPQFNTQTFIPGVNGGVVDIVNYRA